jgi:hypothetical protein
MHVGLLYLAVLALVTTGGPAAAVPHPLCEGTGAVEKMSLTARGTRLRFRAMYTPPAGFDPAAAGLTIDVAYEPETDPANDAYTATLPPGALVTVPRGLRYRDPSGAIAGVTDVKILDRPDGAKRITVTRRKGAVIGPLARAGAVRIVLTAGTATADPCVRLCNTACELFRGPRLKCRRSTDTAFCRQMSGCELLNLDEAASDLCLLPYPSNAFTRSDPTQQTGRRLDYGRRAMPANFQDIHVDPARWNLLDGFSPGPIAITHFPEGIDLALSNTPSHTDFSTSVDPASPTVLIEADTPGCVRVEHFAENDVSEGASGPVAAPNQVFMLRPGRRLRNATRYIVALRGLVDQSGQPLRTRDAFRLLRDGIPSGSGALEARRPAFEAMFAKLASDCGVPRAGLQLAWDFTTASDDSIQRYLLHMRDETFALLGPTSAPAFTVTHVEDDPFAGDTRVCRRVRGTYQVPLWTTADGPGSVLNVDPDTNLPFVHPTIPVTNAPFTVMIPCSLVGPTPTAGRPVVYGHGLLGTGFGEVTAGNLRTLANTYGFVIAATDWQGFSQADVGTIVVFTRELTGFARLSERLHQGVLNQLVLARLMKAPDGLGSHSAFQYPGPGGPVSVIDGSDVFYYGNSQGGIMGGTVMALSTETTRGILGVPAANFSTLLQRSVDFEPYFILLRGGYPDDLQRALTYPLIQQLWDRSEPNGWYHRTVSNPLPGTPAHEVLVHMATSDAEVANLATEIMVRSMGIPQVAPPVKSYYGIPELAAPFDGSAMVESDGHYGPVPETNTPPGNNGAHGAMRALPAIQAQIDQFLRTAGSVQNFCTGPCDPE